MRARALAVVCPVACLEASLAEASLGLVVLAVSLAVASQVLAELVARVRELELEEASPAQGPRLRRWID